MYADDGPVWSQGQKATHKQRRSIDLPLGTVQIVARHRLFSDLFPNPVDVLHKAGFLVHSGVLPHHLLAQHKHRVTGVDRPRAWTDKLSFDRRDVHCSLRYCQATVPRCVEKSRTSNQSPTTLSSIQLSKIISPAATARTGTTLCCAWPFGSPCLTGCTGIHG